MLIVHGDKIGTSNLANLYNGVLILSNVGLKDEQLLMTGLCTSACPYKITGWHPTGEIFLYNATVRLLLSQILLRMF